MAGHAARAVGRTAAFAVLGITALLLAGCTTDGPPRPTETPEPTEPTRAVPAAVAAPAPIAFAPIRGTLVEPGAAAHPSLGVKIDNHVDARPQVALNRADVVFEELVEGGITRYLSIWQSDVPDEIGPVRSIRPMDPDIITPFGGLIAYSGGQEQFVDMMMSTPLPNLVFDYDDTGLFYRADERPGPHDVILKAAEAVARYPELPPPPVLGAYGAADPLAAPRFAAQPTSRIDAVFSDARFPSWEWDGANGVWLRSQEGDPDFEASGDRVRATNVVTIRLSIDWSYGEVPRTVLDGGGEAWVSVGGRTAHGAWSKAGRESMLALTADDGSPLPLAPGTTWFELVPLEDGSVAFAP
ncbi:DUF3048 domain-containing protein [Agromyces protaetiae]|uniref:DUF3048 domain-containing protein n=1 Tax=Agromyces protaetiae TaxID=2509455 RepID=A0A4V0YH33_9MICO|nr:DUF3048 domain-containing protein [Agromyces protaetiae]QAY73311.1 DUF3048 domain-containing protein [Agromyces protaetiae]